METNVSHNRLYITVINIKNDKKMPSGTWNDEIVGKDVGEINKNRFIFNLTSGQWK
jgi:hypothetical protein